MESLDLAGLVDDFKDGSPSAGAALMKVVSECKSYIDYTHGNFGVRVWKDRCQAIRRDQEGADWVGCENVFPVPVPNSILGFPHSGFAPTTRLAFEVAKYDDKERDPELRGLVKGWMPFEQALSSV